MMPTLGNQLAELGLNFAAGKLDDLGGATELLERFDEANMTAMQRLRSLRRSTRPQLIFSRGRSSVSK